MGWGWGSLLRSDSLARCEKQKDKRLRTDYSRLDIMHHLRYDGTYRLSLFMELSQGVDVNYVMPCMLPGHVSQGPFHSYGVRRHLVNRARNDVLHKNKLKEKLFSICLATCTTHPRTSGTWPLQTTPHPQARRAGIVPVVAQGVVTSLIELCISDILENQKPLFPDPWLVQTVCLLLAVVSSSYWNFRPWRNSQPQELVMGLCHEQTSTRYNVCAIIENCWRK